ncbi:hypothetical protein [Streptomyces sp. NPDC096030]|uniref:hypothetical protein n=1 Tax=Streptomyces sp. NPDC096030 TaxID=3155423 RepID=UPI00331F5B3D
MGYARYEIYRNGKKIEAGYAVETTCEKNGCDARIDRGLAHLCGKTPGGDEHGCGGYYCENHLNIGPTSETGELCDPCYSTHEAEHPKGDEERVTAS